MIFSFNYRPAIRYSTEAGKQGARRPRTADHPLPIRLQQAGPRPRTYLRLHLARTKLGEYTLGSLCHVYSYPPQDKAFAAMNSQLAAGDTSLLAEMHAVLREAEQGAAELGIGSGLERQARISGSSKVELAGNAANAALAAGQRAALVSPKSLVHNLG